MKPGIFHLNLMKWQIHKKDQVIVWLRWVDAGFDAHEKFIGLHHVADITTDTIVRVLKDTVLQMNLNLSVCRGQCYDGAANMKKVAKRIQEIQPKALYLHCFEHTVIWTWQCRNWFKFKSASASACKRWSWHFRHHAAQDTKVHGSPHPKWAHANNSSKPPP